MKLLVCNKVVDSSPVLVSGVCKSGNDKVSVSLAIEKKFEANLDKLYINEGRSKYGDEGCAIYKVRFYVSADIKGYVVLNDSEIKSVDILIFRVFDNEKDAYKFIKIKSKKKFVSEILRHGKSSNFYRVERELSDIFGVIKEFDGFYEYEHPSILSSDKYWNFLFKKFGFLKVST